MLCDDFERESTVREISVLRQQPTTTDSSMGLESGTRRPTARLESSVTTIATLTPGRLAGGLGVRIARKRSPVELLVRLPHVARPDDGLGDESGVSVVSPSPISGRPAARTRSASSAISPSRPNCTDQSSGIHNPSALGPIRAPRSVTDTVGTSSGAPRRPLESFGSDTERTRHQKRWPQPVMRRLMRSGDVPERQNALAHTSSQAIALPNAARFGLSHALGTRTVSPTDEIDDLSTDYTPSSHVVDHVDASLERVVRQTGPQDGATNVIARPDRIETRRVAAVSADSGQRRRSGTGSTVWMTDRHTMAGVVADSRHTPVWHRSLRRRDGPTLRQHRPRRNDRTRGGLDLLAVHASDDSHVQTRDRSREGFATRDPVSLPHRVSRVRPSFSSPRSTSYMTGRDRSQWQSRLESTASTALYEGPITEQPHFASVASRVRPSFSSPRSTSHMTGRDLSPWQPRLESTASTVLYEGPITEQHRFASVASRGPHTSTRRDRAPRDQVAQAPTALASGSGTMESQRTAIQPTGPVWLSTDTHDARKPHRRLWLPSATRQESDVSGVTAGQRSLRLQRVAATEAIRLSETASPSASLSNLFGGRRVRRILETNTQRRIDQLRSRVDERAPSDRVRRPRRVLSRRSESDTAGRLPVGRSSMGGASDGDGVGSVQPVRMQSPIADVAPASVSVARVDTGRSDRLQPVSVRTDLDATARGPSPVERRRPQGLRRPAVWSVQADAQRSTRALSYLGSRRDLTRAFSREIERKPHSNDAALRSDRYLSEPQVIRSPVQRSGQAGRFRREPGFTDETVAGLPETVTPPGRYLSESRVVRSPIQRSGRAGRFRREPGFTDETVAGPPETVTLPDRSLRVNTPDTASRTRVAADRVRDRAVSGGSTNTVSEIRGPDEANHLARGGAVGNLAVQRDRLGGTARHSSDRLSVLRTLPDGRSHSRLPDRTTASAFTVITPSALTAGSGRPVSSERQPVVRPRSSAGTYWEPSVSRHGYESSEHGRNGHNLIRDDRPLFFGTNATTRRQHSSWTQHERRGETRVSVDNGPAESVSTAFDVVDPTADSTAPPRRGPPSDPPAVTGMSIRDDRGTRSTGVDDPNRALQSGTAPISSTRSTGSPSRVALTLTRTARSVPIVATSLHRRRPAGDRTRVRAARSTPELGDPDVQSRAPSWVEYGSRTPSPRLFRTTTLSSRSTPATTAPRTPIASQADQIGVPSSIDSVEATVDETDGRVSIDTADSVPALQRRLPVASATRFRNRRFQPSRRLQRRSSMAQSGATRSPDGTRLERDRFGVSPLVHHPREHGSESPVATRESPSRGQWDEDNDTKDNRTINNRIESIGQAKMETGRRTNTGAKRPSLTYRTTANADTPSVDRGSSHRPTDDMSDPTVASTGSSRGPRPRRSSRERRQDRQRYREPEHEAPARAGDDSDRTQAAFRSDTDPNPGSASRGQSGSRDDGRPWPGEKRQPSIQRPEPSVDATPDSARHRRHRFDGVDVPASTDPRFDADVDRAVQELYRKLERKLRIERDRRGL
ncbi:hypothetical protein BDK88_0700 [Natrinema hispanicum]|uniref:Uncharacterized protein n=2 Tax=Natrinema hispanicum TaxID=392421 RepID=A0A482Y9B5_9EURY|nr:hypothetical protein BDK88_0700 [Natrinema hispanicum]